MRSWALELLRCVECGGERLTRDPDALVCAACGARFAVEDGVTDFLAHPHPAVAREIAAVARLDRGSLPATVRELIGALDRCAIADAGDPRLREFPSFAEFATTRRRARAMLAELRPPPGAVVAELGADHCLSSGVLLDAGCRVIAVDITDHLRLAPRPDHPDLCRLQADMNRLPLRDGAADLVWATACVHHSWDLAKTFREARRVLGESGRLVLLNEPMPAWPRYLGFGLGRRFGAEQRRLGINETLHRRSAWLQAARRAGFEPTLRFPELSDAELRARLERRRLPGWLAPLASRAGRLLQVSIHMVARPDPSAAS